ncbi:hypothetical protein EBF16_00085 (plasmid) [Sphingobium yanoikuyae]|jgi:hypothetical protein|uniref:Uncharacterized protein n=1 Tax=Sphingobium yanoikuyae TaxID=13690 RepID=A0A3G2ULG4_SPHYA|nr:hypothetical protein EBF16_00085 [Sphingobium yanoikuyae]
MTNRRRTWTAPTGRQYALQLLTEPRGVVEERALAAGEKDLFDAAAARHEGRTAPAFLNSALCAMSLPTGKPKGDEEFKPIIRQDNRLSMVITPKPRMVQAPGGGVELVNLGVPYGAYPRIILIKILTDAVMTKSRDVYLGGSFADMMRRFGYEGASRGKRGQTTGFLEQLDRLLACEWMIHWQENDAETQENAFAVNEVKLTHQYAGVNGPDGSFNRELRLSEVFYNHLQEHAIRFDMSAIYALKRNPTAIDLYTYLALRLNKIPVGKPVELDYTQLAAHMGNRIKTTTKLRQTMRNALHLVSGVYPEAQIEISDKKVRMHHSPQPLPTDGQQVKLISMATSKSRKSSQPKATEQSSLELVPASDITFPSSGFRWSADKALQEIARKEGNGYDLEIIADNYRAFMKAKNQDLTKLSGERLIKSFAGFCRTFKPANF